MNKDIRIIEKPDWVSWDEIKRCLYEAHEINRSKGINMTHHQWPVEKIKESLGGNGIILVALDGNKLIGTAAIAEKKGKSWYNNGHYAYVCFDGVIPTYAGNGIFQSLDTLREKKAKEYGYSMLVFDTHSRNVSRQKIALKHGYKYVCYFWAKSGDHYSVIMAKWLNGCPYSAFYCWMRFQISKFKALIRKKISIYNEHKS